jgi:hypothetical protein
VDISAISSQTRIFVTVDIAADVVNKTIKPQITINADKIADGLERVISPGASAPDIPQAPLARFGQALSTSTIRWSFLDLSGNEFGFRIKDSSLRTKVEVSQSNLSYIDETGLAPNTIYSGRRVVAFNDRGENLGSALAVFPEVATLPLPVVTTTPPMTQEPATSTVITEVPIATTTATTTETEQKTPTEKSASELIQELQLQLISLLTQLLQLLQQLAGLQ